MKNENSRREFLIGCTGALCCIGISGCSRLFVHNRSAHISKKLGEDISTMAYCGIQCDDRCKLFRATKNSDIELKKQVAKEWFNKDGEEFNEKETFCYGCKTKDKPQNKFLKECTVIKCATDKKYFLCAQCDELENCDKKLWINWPKMRTNALEQQKKLRS